MFYSVKLKHAEVLKLPVTQISVQYLAIYLSVDNLMFNYSQFLLWLFRDKGCTCD